MRKNTFRFFDQLEDRIRGRLSRFPILYSFIGAVGIVLFWRGVWLMADHIPVPAFIPDEFLTFSSGFISFAIGLALLLLTGLFVSFFVGDSILISGIRNEKKLIEKTEEEVQAESTLIRSLSGEVEKENEKLITIQKEISEIKTLITQRK
ncbi:MAG: hypothetical protein AAB545_03135 [Patescibacteria group bacterium]